MEEAVIFGRYNHLLGIKSVVGTEDKTQASVAVILVTPGMLHNAGPFRMYVDVARDLQSLGIPSLRFDISGIGESLGIGASGRSIDRAASEIKEAMDYLQQTHGIQQFILFGLCSGADDSMQAALHDTRVKGVIALDGLGYPTWGFRLRRLGLYARKILSITKLGKKIKRIFGSSLAPVSLATGGDVREFPETSEQAAKEIDTLIKKRTNLHFIYTGGTDYYNHSKQFFNMFPMINWPQENVSTKYFPQMDHVVMLCEDRVELVKHVSQTTQMMIHRLNPT